MPIVRVNGVGLSYDVTGSGEPVVLVMGSGAGRRAWHVHQVPALVAAGYRVFTYDHRGIPPSEDCPAGFTVHDLAADLAGLIERLDLGACRIVGTSMGSHVTQELALARPELMRQVVLMATRGRSDRVRAALSRAEYELHRAGIDLPASYHATVRALQVLSPRTLDDDREMADWLDLFELAAAPMPGLGAQLRLEPMPDRLVAYRQIRVACHVIAFADDLITPPGHGRELADAIPGATFELITECGHYGYLENPKAVNASILEFFQRPTRPVAGP